MGLAASQARFLRLTGKLSLTQMKGQNVNNQRTQIASKLNSMMNSNKSNNGVSSPFESRETDILSMINSGKGKKSKSNSIFGANKTNSSSKSSSGELDQGILASLFAEDSKLQGMLAVFRTEENILKTEMASVQKVIDKNVESSFKMLA